MTQTALDECMRAIRWRYKHPDKTSLDDAVRYQRHWFPGNFSRAIQDPIYLSYCREQDRKEDELSARLTRITYAGPGVKIKATIR